MGAHLVRRYATAPDEEPNPYKLPTFDPMYGFPEGRKERVMVATWEQLNDAQIPLDARDYCSHYLLVLLKCKRDNFPAFWRCKHEKHDLDYCEHLDFVMRMKEYERERRLLVRKKRIEKKKAEAAAAAAAAAATTS